MPQLESLLDNTRERNNIITNNNDNDHDNSNNDDDNDTDNRIITEETTKISQLILAKETSEALVQDLKLKATKSDKLLANKDTAIAQLKDELKKAKADNDALVKVNQNIHSDIIKNERYKKVNTVEQDLLSKSVEMLKETSLNLKNELIKLQSSHDLALKKLRQSNSENTSLSKSLQEVTITNERIKQSMANEKLIASIAKADLSTHNQQIEIVRSKFQSLESKITKLNAELSSNIGLKDSYKKQIDEEKKVNKACEETLNNAKLQHTNLVKAQNEIMSKKDKEMEILMEKVVSLQALVDSKSNSKMSSDIGVELGLELDVLLNNDFDDDNNALDEHKLNPGSNNRIKTDTSINTPPPPKISPPPAKKVTFLNTIDTTNDTDVFSNTSNSNTSTKRKARDISMKPQDYLESNDDTNKVICPSCCDHAYGFMTTCKACRQQHHSSCAKKLPNYSKSAFLCELCHENSSNE